MCCLDAVAIDFDEVLVGLNAKTLTYLDVRNQTELQGDGQVAGSVNIPSNNCYTDYFHRAAFIQALLYFLVPELNEAFNSDARAFEKKYGFAKPDKTSNSLVIACKSGVRAQKAAEALQLLGYNSLR